MLTVALTGFLYHMFYGLRSFKNMRCQKLPAFSF